MADNIMNEVAVELMNVSGVKFGDFVLKSGERSPIYFDLRVTISYPLLLEKISSLLWDKVKFIPCDVLCGVPYTALPFTTCISLKQNIPMVMRRQEVKNHGTKRTIEGVFQAGNKCLVVEDIVTSGASIMETMRDLRNVGLEVSDAVVLLDREQGGKELLAKEGITLHNIFTTRQMLSILLKAHKLTPEMFRTIDEYITSSQLTKIPTSQPYLRMKFEDRSALCKCLLKKQIFDLILQKRSNLCLSADVLSSEKLLDLAETVGPNIVILKTHIDIIQDFNNDLISRLTEVARKHKFLIFEDRKFCDIGNTVEMQYSGGIHNICKWADLVTAQAVPGPSVLNGLKKVQAAQGGNKGCILVVEMSSAGNFTSEDYKNSALKMAKGYEDLVVGVVCQSPVNIDPTMISFIPGVKMNSEGDGLGQQYVSPRDAVLAKGADIIIVGRGITAADDPKVAAALYQSEGYQAYEERCQKV